VDRRAIVDGAPKPCEFVGKPGVMLILSVWPLMLPLQIA